MAWSTASRLSVELTAWPTSPSARSWSTERPSSAVRCCSSLNSRDVLDRDDRLVGEGLEQRDLLVGEGPHLVARHGDGADRLALSQHGHGDEQCGTPVRCARPRGAGQLVAVRASRCPRMWTGRRSTMRAPRREGPRERARLGNAAGDRARSGPRHRTIPSFEAQHRGVVGARTAAPRSRAMVSNTGWRSVGELEMTRRISPVAVCCSSASVSSRLRVCSSVNRRTFSMAMTAWSAKVWSSAICCVGERAELGAADLDGADGSALAEQRHGEDGPVAGAGLERSADREIGLVRRPAVVDVDGPPLRYRAPASTTRDPAGGFRGSRRPVRNAPRASEPRPRRDGSWRRGPRTRAPHSRPPHRAPAEARSATG